MVSAPLLVCDFDGVLVDGLPEYWWSARRAALDLAPHLQLPEALPEAFVQLRPLIHQGWEMVLVAAELSRADWAPGEWLAGYDRCLAPALLRWGWSAVRLQEVLERVRREAIARDVTGWLALHRFYPGVELRLRQLPDEGVAWAVLTTKGEAFARQLLEAAGLQPCALFGHEQGSKSEVLARLLAQQDRPIWFLEDRRPTLEAVSTDPRLASVRCFLASWGYLAPSDPFDLPTAIRLLEPQRFRAPLAEWL
jgi:phosphoglycolate phosphatase-like HAD superfamily hydrolase